MIPGSDSITVDFCLEITTLEDLNDHPLSQEFPGDGKELHSKSLK